MPVSAPKVCAHPGCGRLSHAMRCDLHSKQREAEQQAIRVETDKRRGSPTARGYGAAWQGVRVAVLMGEPLCRLCTADGHTTAAAVVDHIDGNSRNNDTDNLRPLCKRCHDRRTGRDQAWGRKH